MRAARIALTALVLAALMAVPSTAQAPAETLVTVEGQAPVDRAVFDHWMVIAAYRAEGPIKGVPDTPEYAVCVSRGASRAACARRWRELRDQVVGFLIAAAWVHGEAAARGISVSPAELDRAYREQTQQAFASKTAFERYLRESGATEADIRFQIEVEQLQQRLVAAVTRGADKVSPAAISRYYRRHPSEFATPERRDIVMVLSRRKTRALRAIDALHAGRSWRATARAYSDDAFTRRRGGREWLTRGTGGYGRAFLRAVFAAPRGVLVGPVKTRGGWLVFEVRHIHRRRQQTLAQAAPTIRSLLASVQQQQALDDFLERYRKRWRARTRCRAGFVTEDCGSTLLIP